MSNFAIEAINKVIKRTGEHVNFDRIKIENAMRKAFEANGIFNLKIIQQLTDAVLIILKVRFDGYGSPAVEDIQDIVEEVLIQSNYPKVAKDYILYREKHKQLRESTTQQLLADQILLMSRTGGAELPVDIHALQEDLSRTIKGLSDIDQKTILDEVCRTLYSGITETEVEQLVLNAVKSKMELHYNYSFLGSRLLLNAIYKTNLSRSIYAEDLSIIYRRKFTDYAEEAVRQELVDPKLLEFDLQLLSENIQPERDQLFLYLGMQTLVDRYLIKHRQTREVMELPQWMWMRVAMGLALNEPEKEKRAIEFYEVLSNLFVVTSTPTLFNSGTMHPQLSSCYVNQVEDSMTGIFKTIADCAQLSKWAGGIGTDWTSIRGKGAPIKGTNGESQGIIPFIKIFNDVALAVNQGGKRKGAMAAYLEPWHADIEEFIELKKNTGDERRRAHDIHTALVIPDLFMKRVREKQDWTLFSPDQVPDLHNLYGQAFERRYIQYEQQNIPKSRRLSAAELWRKILTMLYETGHPWITFKDPINLRSPQDHVGVIHNSNLCTEITLNNASDETAVCNLASINLSRMITGGQLDTDRLARSVKTAVRMLDNVIDINFYPIPEARQANQRHRPIGLGMMGYQDALYQLAIDFDSEANLRFADDSMELIAYHAFLSSSELAKERGTYASYAGSKWSRGILPQDTLAMVAKERGEPLKIDDHATLDWTMLRAHITSHGMRNSNCLALAPTATISNIAGTTPSVEPVYKNIYMKENLSGNFVIINRHLIDVLNQENCWTPEIVAQIKYCNGSIQDIDTIPDAIKRRFKEVFELDPQWILQAAARRGKWIDQSASTNIYMKSNSGKLLSELYFLAWELGLKTTYYLRTLAASQVTKQSVGPLIQQLTHTKPIVISNPDVKLCSLLDPSCEACQ